MPPRRPQRGKASTSSKRANAPRTPSPVQRYAHLIETPLSKKVSGAMPYTSMHYKRDMRMNDLGAEMRGKFAGPISPSEFLNVFLPFPKGTLARMPRRMKGRFRRVATRNAETAMYTPMVCLPIYACRTYLYDLSRLNPSRHTVPASSLSTRIVIRTRVRTTTNPKSNRTFPSMNLVVAKISVS
jgi:hypothetical protein